MVDKFITLAGIFNGVLPLQVKLMTFLMKTFEFFSSLVKLNLSSLSLGNFLFKLLALVADFNRQFLNLKGELLNLGLIGTSILLEGEVIFLLLTSSQRPLFQFFLVPVHFQFELVHTLISFKDHVLDVVKTVLLIGNTLL